MKGPVICLFFGVCLAVAQGPGFRQYTMGMLGTAFFHDVITGKPYSAKRVEKHVRTLQDGTHITDVSTVLQYRDADGRTRLDEQVPTMKDLGFIIIEIDDPVAGYHYTLDALDKVAYRIEMTQNVVPGLSMKLPRPLASASCAARVKLPAKAEEMGEDIENEELGTRVIGGLVVEGTRSTTKTPAGLMDNDQPLTHVQEIWFSTDICSPVLRRFWSPQGEESTSELTDISTTQPDSALFQIPPDYKIVDKAGRFEIRLRAPAKQ